MLLLAVSGGFFWYNLLFIFIYILLLYEVAATLLQIVLMAFSSLIN